MQSQLHSEDPIRPGIRPYEIGKGPDIAVLIQAQFTFLNCQYFETQEKKVRGSQP